MPLNRDELVFMANISEQTERYDEMYEFVKQLVKLGQGLSPEERNLLIVANKNIIYSYRTPQRILHNITYKEQQKGVQSNLKFLAEYSEKIQRQLISHCEDYDNLISDFLIEDATDISSQVYFLKLKGDNLKLICNELPRNEANNKYLIAANTTYSIAHELAKTGLQPYDPILLQISLHYSLTKQTLLLDLNQAIRIAKEAFAKALAVIDEIPEEHYQTSTMVMQLLRDNITLWTEQIFDND